MAKTNWALATNPSMRIRGFTAKEIVAELKAGANKWRRDHGGSGVTYRPNDNGHIDVIFTSAPLPGQVGAETSRHNVITLNSRLAWPKNRPYLAAVVCHELGHCFGWGHTEDGDSVMNAYLRVFGPSDEDMARARHRFGPAPNLVRAAMDGSLPAAGPPEDDWEFEPLILMGGDDGGEEVGE